MKKYMVLLCAIMMVFSSCHKYNTNNSNNENNDDNNQGGNDVPAYSIGECYKNQGIVFQINSGGAHGLIVSLDEDRLAWCVESQLSTNTYATNASDGWNNANSIVTKPNWKESFPAMAWAVNKNSNYTNGQIQSKQWYLPAKNELRNLILNQEKVNQALTSLGYPTLKNKTYWSSTEISAKYAFSEQENHGEMALCDSLKTYQHYVRAIKSF